MDQEVSVIQDDPVIHYYGIVEFRKAHHCRWKTMNEFKSTCIIANPSQDNTLTISVSGAPQNLYIKNPDLVEPFNGTHRISSFDNPIIASGDFQGRTVTINNLGPPYLTCVVEVRPDNSQHKK